MTCQSQSSRLNHPDYNRWATQTMKFLFVEPSPLPNLIPLGSKYLPLGIYICVCVCVCVSAFLIGVFPRLAAFRFSVKILFQLYYFHLLHYFTYFKNHAELTKNLYFDRLIPRDKKIKSNLIEEIVAREEGMKSSSFLWNSVQYIMHLTPRLSHMLRFHLSVSGNLSFLASLFEN